MFPIFDPLVPVKVVVFFVKPKPAEITGIHECSVWRPQLADLLLMGRAHFQMKHRLQQVNDPIQICSAVLALGVFMVYWHKQLFESFCLFFKAFHFSFEYTLHCALPSEKFISVFKASAKAFVPFSNLKGIDAYKNLMFCTGVVYMQLARTQKSWFGTIGIFFSKQRMPTKPVFYFSNPTRYICIFLKYSKARWDEKSHVVELRFVLLLFYEHYIVWKKSHLLVVHGCVGHIKSVSLARLPRTGRLIFIIYK